VNRKTLFKTAIRTCVATLVLAWGSAKTQGLAQVQEVGLRMDVNKREVQVGDRITLTIEFRQLGNSGSSEVQAPSIHTPENFQIRSTSSATQVSIVNQQTAQVSTTKLSLEATRPGTETLGPAILIFRDAQGQAREIKSNVITVTVTEKKKLSIFGSKKRKKGPTPTPEDNPSAAATPEEEQLRDIKPLLSEPFPFLKTFFYLVLLAAVAYLIWRLFFRKKGSRAVTPPTPEKAAQLREAWRKLADEELTAKEFCLGLANLVRECLEYRFGFPAVDLTTEEILRETGKNKLTADELDAVEKCLKATDRVLYADGNLTGRDNLRTCCSGLLPRIQKK
jgi:hypothetical protein